MTPLTPYDLRRGKRARKWVGAFALQLWVAVAFFVMAFAAAAASTPTYPGVWPYLFALTAAMAVASMVMPYSTRTAAATGAVLAMVSIARATAVLDAYLAFLEFPNVLTMSLLWGFPLVVGLRWPSVCYQSGLRHLLDVANDRPSDPGPIPGPEA